MICVFIIQPRLLTDEGLPFTSGSRIASDGEVRLKTEFTRDWGQGFAHSGATAGGASTLQECL